jgi:DNA-directed RNA polymerase specialized sigma24 family protein
VLYERFYLTSAARNRMINHLRNTDRTRAYALVDAILATARSSGR